MEIINKREFAAVTLNVDDETFILHVATLVKPTTMPIYPSCQAQVITLTSKKTGTPAEYSDFSNVFFLDFAAELPEHTEINDHLINLLDDKQLPYIPIYGLELVKLEMLKTYIKASLASCFIRPFKSLAVTLILFV